MTAVIYIFAIIVYLLYLCLFGWLMSIIWNGVFINVLPALPFITWWKMVSVIVFIKMLLGIISFKIDLRKVASKNE